MTTPPQIVANAEDPREALAAFIAQELDNWGFDVRLGLIGRSLRVVHVGDFYFTIAERPTVAREDDA